MTKKQTRPSLTTFLQRAKALFTSNSSTRSTDYRQGGQDALAIAEELFRGTDIFNVQQQLADAQADLEEVSYQLAQARNPSPRPNPRAAGSASRSQPPAMRTNFRQKFEKAFLTLIEPLSDPESDRVAATLQLLWNWLSGGIVGSPDMSEEQTQQLTSKFDAYRQHRKLQQESLTETRVVVKKVKRMATGKLEVAQRARIAELEAILARRTNWEKHYDRGLKRLADVLDVPIEGLQEAAGDHPGLNLLITRWQSLRGTVEHLDVQEQEPSSADGPVAEE